MKRLNRTFFNRPTIIVAKELLGKILVFKNSAGVITETEAYCGLNDPASHAFKGETPRTKIMFGRAGFSYVYLIYGIYHCLNFVTEKSGCPGAVLIRGIKLLDKSELHLDGPGKLCRHLGITKEHNGLDIITGSDFSVYCVNNRVNFVTTPRIGIKEGLDKHWRFLAVV